MLALALFSGCSSDKAEELCEAIETGDNQKAVQIAEKMGSLDVQSTAMPGLVSSFEGEVTTPLVKACETGNKEMIIWLLDHGASTDYAPGNILYPLEAFCESGSGAGVEAMQKLLDCGADPEEYKGIQPVFRLAGTLEHRDEKTVQDGIDMVIMLLRNGAEWTNKIDGKTLLHYAAWQKDGTFMKSLLAMEEAKSFVNAKDYTGKTPKDIAEERGNQECVALLQEK